MTGWLDAAELRIGLGCMRLRDDDEVAQATIVAAADAGVTVFDTARSYAGNEQLLARALRGRTGRIVTKGGMARPDGGWGPDGRARPLRHDCEASLEALDGLPIDLYLVHTPDPRTPWRTTVGALARLAGEGAGRRGGGAAGASASRTSTARSSTRRSPSRPSPRSRSPSARSTTGRCAAASWSAATS